MKLRNKLSLLKAAKAHFKAYPSGSISMSYDKIIPDSGEIGVFCYNFKTFKFELNYALKSGVNVSELLFKF